MAFVGRAVEDPEIIARLAGILASDWDPAGVVRAALNATSTFYHDQAVVVAGMLSADAHENEVQRYLRQLEQQAGPTTLHPADVRHTIAVALWRAARQL